MTDEATQIRYIDMVDEAWRIAEQAQNYTKTLGHEPPTQEVYEKVFLQTGIVDTEKTAKEGGNPLLKVFFKNPYGLQYRPDHKNWIPFRHGELKL
jgi:hypothetical protein